MSKWLKAVSLSVYGLLVASTLAVGVAVALATPASATDCPYNGEGLMGWQPSAQACYNACYAVHGENLETSHWNESNGCCTCVF